jgi:hypothetical protein
MAQIFQTHHFCVGPEEYFKTRLWNSCFAESRHVTYWELLRSMHKLVDNERDVVLVVHGGEHDLKFLVAAKIHLRPIYIIDTQKAAEHLLELSHRPTLQDLLLLLKCPLNPGRLHNAGNDANFTLRALLLIAATDARNESDPDPTCEAFAGSLREIAREHLPMKEFLETVARRECSPSQKRRRNRNTRRKEENQSKNPVRQLKDSTRTRILLYVLPFYPASEFRKSYIWAD